MTSGSDVFMENVMAINNYSNYSGGGIQCYGGKIAIEDSQMSGNIAPWSGGGAEISETDYLCINNVMISDNYAGGNGGGLVLGLNGGTTILSNSVITGNSCSLGGWGSIAGGVLIGSSNPIFTNVTISDNACEIGGGAFWVSFGSIPTFTDCIM